MCVCVALCWASVVVLVRLLLTSHHLSLPFLWALAGIHHHPCGVAVSHPSPHLAEVLRLQLEALLGSPSPPVQGCCDTLQQLCDFLATCGGVVTAAQCAHHCLWLVEQVALQWSVVFLRFGRPSVDGTPLLSAEMLTQRIVDAGGQVVEELQRLAELRPLLRKELPASACHALEWLLRSVKVS